MSNDLTLTTLMSIFFHQRICLQSVIELTIEVSTCVLLQLDQIIYAKSSGNQPLVMS